MFASIGLVGGTSYFKYYKSEDLAKKQYGQNDTTLNMPISSPSTILGEAYNQCYPLMGVSESGSYTIDNYEASIDGEAGTITGGATGTELTQTIIELGCLLNALNINSSQAGSSTLKYLLTNAALNASPKNDMMGQKNLIIKPYEISVITMITSNLSAPSPLAGIIFAIIPHPMLTGYKWNTAILPNVSTINENATYNSSASDSVSVLGGLINGLTQALGGGGGTFSSIFSNSSNNNSTVNSNENGNENSNNQSTFSGGTSSSSTSTTPNSSSHNTSSSPTNSPNINGNASSNTDSSTSTDQNSDAAVDLNATKVCANKGPNTYFNESDSGSPFVTTSGTKEWGQMMACVAQQSQMPSSVEIGLKNFLSNYVSALKNNSRSLQGDR